jgi:uncharacterized phiE125 gp8 family phage protein
VFDGIDVVVPPVEEPVFLADAIKHVRGLKEGDEAALQQMLIASRMRGEAFTRRSFCTQTLDIWYNDPSGLGYFDLPRGNVKGVVGISTFGYDGVETVLDVDDFSLAGTSLLYGLYAWPAGYRLQRGIKIRILSGYGDPEDVPEALKLGIMQYAAHMYENRLGEGPDAKYAMEANRGLLPGTVQDIWRAYQLVMV